MSMTTSCGATPAGASPGAEVPGAVAAPAPVPVAVPQAVSAADTVKATMVAITVRMLGVLVPSGSGRGGLQRLEVASQGLVPGVGRQLRVQGGDGDGVLAHRRRAHAQLAQEAVGDTATLPCGLALHQHVGAGVADL